MSERTERRADSANDSRLSRPCFSFLRLSKYSVSSGPDSPPSFNPDPSRAARSASSSASTSANAAASARTASACPLAAA